MSLVQNEWEARKAIWPPCPASAAFHDTSYLGSWCQTGIAQMFSCILGLSMFVTYCFHSHALTVLAITQLLSAFCLLPSPFMCSWFQMLYFSARYLSLDPLMSGARTLFAVQDFSVNCRMLPGCLPSIHWTQGASPHTGATIKNV